MTWLTVCPSCAPVRAARELFAGVGSVSDAVLVVAPYVLTLIVAMMIVRVLDRRR